MVSITKTNIGASILRAMLVIALIGVSLLISSCDSLTSNPKFDGEVYSIAALLMAGYPINEDWPVYLTRSSSIENWNIQNLFVQQAVIKIIRLDNGEEFLLQAVPDVSGGKVKWVDPLKNVIEPEKRYRIEVRIAGYDKVISAETQVPPMARLERDYFGFNVEGEGFGPDPFNMPQLQYSSSDIRYPLALDLGSRTGAYNLIAELYCMEDFSTDLEYTTPIFGMTNPSEDMETSYNSSGEGFRRIRYMGRFTAETQPEYNSSYILLRNYRQGFIFFGRYSVSMIVVDDNYYRYNYMPEAYLHGGVQNGLGFFGSASGGLMFTKVVK